MLLFECRQGAQGLQNWPINRSATRQSAAVPRVVPARGQHHQRSSGSSISELFSSNIARIAVSQRFQHLHSDLQKGVDPAKYPP